MRAKWLLCPDGTVFTLTSKFENRLSESHRHFGSFRTIIGKDSMLIMYHYEATVIGLLFLSQSLKSTKRTFITRLKLPLFSGGMDWRLVYEFFLRAISTVDHRSSIVNHTVNQRSSIVNHTVNQRSSIVDPTVNHRSSINQLVNRCHQSSIVNHYQSCLTIHL